MDMNWITIRDSTLSEQLWDLPNIRRIFQAAMAKVITPVGTAKKWFQETHSMSGWYSNLDAHTLQQYAENRKIVVAESDGVIIWYIGTEIRSDMPGTVSISVIACDPDFQRIWVWAALFRSLLIRYPTSFFETWSIDNPAQLGFYEFIWFERTSISTKWAWNMRLRFMERSPC